MIESHNQRAQPEWTYASALRVTLLHTRNVFRNVFYRHGILDRQAMRLGFEPRPVNQYPRIGVQASECKADMLIDEADLRGRDSRILQLHCGSFLAAENDKILAFNAYGACPFLV